MAFNWDKFCKAQRDYPRPKFALDAIGKLLKKRPNDPYILTWKASVLLQLDGRANDALPILTGLCQQQPPITDPNLLPFIYSRILDASRQVNPHVLAPSSVGAEGLKAWQNAAKVLPTRKAKLRLWSDLFVAAMKEGCWEDVRWATMQANKEGIDIKFKKTLYYSLILANQLGGEKRAEIAKATDKVDPGSQIQLTLAVRQMKEAYDNSPKPTDEKIQVTTMSDMRFMAAIYERQNRCAELFQLWSSPPPAVAKVINSAPWDFGVLLIEVAYRQKEWQIVEEACHQLVDKIWQSGNPTTGNPSDARAAMFNVCTMCWTMWKSLLDATTHLYSKEEGKKKIEKLYSGIWQALPPMEKRTYRALGLTQLSMEAYLDYPILDTITRFYFDCHRNPSCFKDLRRFVVQLSVEDQKKFQATISEHAQDLGANTTGEGLSEEDTKKNIRKWHEAEMTVLKFELLMIVSLQTKPDPTVLEDFVGNALRLWRLQLDAEGSDMTCGSDALFVAVEALIYLFEATMQSQYLYQAAALTRYSLSLDIHRYGRNTALLSTRLHLRLGLGTFAFEHYHRVQVKEMLCDNVAWVALSRISQSHPFGAGGPRAFSADDELKKVIATLSRMENKIDDLVYADMQQFIYDKAFDLLELKRKLRTSLTKQFCIIERRRIARLRGVPVDPTLDLPMRDHEDISDNCHWDAVPGINHTKLGGIRHAHFMTPVTKPWVQNFRTLIDVVNGVVFKEIHPGRVVSSTAPFTPKLAKEDATAPTEEYDTRAHFTLSESGLNEVYWKPIAYILQAIHPTENLSLSTKFGSIGEAFKVIFDQIKIDGDELRADCVDATDSSFDRIPHLTEDGLNGIYGRLEVLRVLNRLLDFLRPISKDRKHPLYEDVSPTNCDLLQEAISEMYRLHRLRIQAIINRLKRSGVAHIRAQIFYGKTGEAVDGVVPDETLDLYSKEYADSAIEAANGVLQIQLG